MQEDVKSIAGAAVSWSLHRDVAHVSSFEEMRELFYSEVRDDPRSAQSMKAQQLFTFLKGMKVDDYVLTPLKKDRVIRIGTIQGKYRFNPQMFGPHHPHTRRVAWIRDVHRDSCSSRLRNKLNQRRTVIAVDEYLDEIARLAQG